LNIQALQERALKLWEVDQASALELGRALCAVRDAMRDEHGAFARWYRENGLEENRVYYCIRRAEGKTAQPTPTTAVRLNNANLAVAKYAPPKVGKFVVDTVRLGPDGTTVTDGFLLLRVGLPAGETCAEAGLIPGNFLSQITEPSNVRFGRDTISITTGDVTQTVARPNASKFPDTEKVFAANPPCTANVPADGVAFGIDIGYLSRLVKALKEVAVEGTAKISVRNGMLRIDYLKPDGQKFEGVVQTK
jgi:hypothetical protein